MFCRELLKNSAQRAHAAESMHREGSIWFGCDGGLTGKWRDAVSADSTARVWDMEIGDCVLLLGGHTGPLTNVAAAADGSLLITTSSDGTARVWELEKGECLHVLIGHTAAVCIRHLHLRGISPVSSHVLRH